MYAKNKIILGENQINTKQISNKLVSKDEICDMDPFEVVSKNKYIKYHYIL